MSDKIENPLAFPDPCNAHPGAHPPDCPKGMTLRDFFAAKAMNGMTSDATALEAIGEMQEKFSEKGSTIVARMSYEIADAMLKERMKK